MSQHMDLQRFFRWLKVDKARASRSREHNLFAPVTDELEARRLLTLNVWIDDSNFVQIAADDDLLQNIDLAYDPNTTTYTITSYNSQSNFFIVSDTSVGLTVTKSDYAGAGNPATLTIVQGIQAVSQFAITTGNSPDTVIVGESPASVFVSTGGGADSIVQSVGLVNGYLLADGGSGLDSFYTYYNFAGNFTVTQSIYGSEFNSELAIDTTIGVNAPTNFINVRTSDIENVQNSVTSPGSNLFMTINGIGGSANGGFLDRTGLQSLGITPFVNERTIDLFGYETIDDVQIAMANDGTNFFVGITGPRLPATDIYNMNPTQGLLRLRTLGGDDIVKASAGVELLTRISVDGGTGADFLSADATLIGGPGNDTLQGGLGNDSLVGNEGDDLFLISAGTDTVNGGAGFDIVRLSGITGSPNFFGIDQTTGVPAVIQVNATITTVDPVSVEQISVQGSTGADFLFVTGDSLTPIPVFAKLDLGNDIADTNAASIGQRTDVYGEGGEDYYLSGPGTDYFYGGDDYDLFDAMYASRDSFDFFDGGSGFNDLYVEGSAFGNNVISALPSGFRVSNTNGTGFTTALNIGSVFVDSAGSGVILNASNEDNVIRTYDSTSDILPPPALNVLVVTGMPSQIRVVGLEAGSFVEIHGQGGNDTFESLGNSDIRVDFFGDSGNDRMIVGEESRLAYFTGGVGIDSVEVTTTLGNDNVDVAASAAGEEVIVNGVSLIQIIGAERLSIDMLAGNDNLFMTSIGADTGLLDYSFSGGEGDDSIQLILFTALGGSVFHAFGGAGNDGIVSSIDGDAILIARGGAGNDAIASFIASELYGDEGDDTLTGSELVDSISGGEGNDMIFAGEGDDFIYGDAGQDKIFWNPGDGSDIVDGGTGQDALFVSGDGLLPNDFVLRSQYLYPILFEVLIAGNVIGGGAIEQVDLFGGSSTDTFSIGDLSLTSITDVNIDLGDDQVADSVSVTGSTANDFVLISGAQETLINGLPWLVKVAGAAFSATTLVDGILFDGHLGEDTIVTASNLINPVLVTINGGAGGDDIRINSPTLGDNTDRVTIDVSADVFADVIQLRNGRNRVIGGDLDVILVSGTENDDIIDVVDSGGRVDISLTPPGFSSSNDLTGFTGVVHIEGLGGNDRIAALAELRSTIWGGDGNDEILVGPAGSLIYGGSGNDEIRGDSGNDTMYGGAGADQLEGNSGNDLMYGEDGDDFLDGGLGLDVLLGGADSDLLLPGPNGTLGAEFVDGGSGLDQVRFDMIGTNGLIGRTAGFVNVGDLGSPVPTTGFNAADVEDLLVFADTQVGGSPGYDLLIQDLTGSQVNFVRVVFPDLNDANTLTLQGTIAGDVIDAGTVLPPGGEPEAQVLMPWGTVWAYTPASAADPLNTLAIEGMEGDDTIKVDDILNEGSFAWRISVSGGDGNDFLSADATIVGGDGNDTLLGGLGDDSLEGGLGDDVFLLSAGLDTFVGGGGFDTVHVFGQANGINQFTVNQVAGFPTSFGVNVAVYQANLSEIENISVQGGSARDELFVSGNSAAPVAITAFLGAGSDVVDTELNTAVNQVVTAWGEAGNDVFISGPGEDNFFGGDDYDIFSISANSYDSANWFDGGTGYNELVVNTPPTGNTIVTAILSGFEVFNTDHSSTTVALNIGNVVVNGGGGGIVINGSNNDDTIRTFDSTSQLTPPPLPGTLLIAGLGADIVINGVVPGQVIDIHGQGGNDTFQSLGNAESILNFFGESGDDRFEVSEESRIATFFGGEGYNHTWMQGTEIFDLIDLFVAFPGTVGLRLNGDTIGLSFGSDEFTVDGLGGSDEIRVALDQVMIIDLYSYEIFGGAGHDIIDLNFGGGSFGHFTVDGGAGDDYLLGSVDASSQIISGGLGNDRVETNAAALVFGNEGNDILIGSDANDSMSGGDGEDALFGGAGNDQLFGDAGDDSIEGGQGFDAMFGGADSDLILPGTNDGLAPEIVDGGSGLDQVRFAFEGTAGLIGRTAGTVNVGEFGGTTDPTSFNSTDVEDLLVDANTTVIGALGMELTIQDLTGSQVNFVRVIFPDVNDRNRLIVQGTIANDAIDASFVLPPGGEPNAQVLMPWGAVWAFTQASQTPLNTLQIEGGEGNDTIKASPYLNEGVFAWNIVLQGDEGDDFLSADATIVGGAGNDTLQGGLGDDSLEGGDGDDVFLLSDGVDTFLGGAGFDIVRVIGSVGADNDFGIEQDTGSPAGISLNTDFYAVFLNEIDQISVQGSTGDDSLGVAGTEANPVAVLAMMGKGSDSVRTVAATPGQLTTAYGQDGNDSMFSGQGTDNFYGGNDFDTFFLGTDSYASFDLFDGGSGFNKLWAFTPEFGTTVFTPIPSGFEISNAAYNGLTKALNVGSLQISAFGTGGIVLNGTNNDDTIRTFDSGSNLLPPPVIGTLIVAGLGTDIVIDSLNPGTPIAIFGQGGNDTFQSLGNAQTDLFLYGNSGDDLFVITEESELATFIGGEGYDRASLQGSAFSEFIELVSSGPAELSLIVDGNPVGLTNLDTEAYTVDALGSADEIQVAINVFAFNFTFFEILGGPGDDIVNLNSGGGSYGHFTVYGGAGEDQITGSSLANSQILDGGLGNDRVQARGKATVFGGVGNDFLIGSENRDFISGDEGNDTIEGGLADDQIFGGADQDLFLWVDQDGYDSIEGGTGQDTLRVLGSAAVGNAFVLQPDQDDTLLYSLRVNAYRITGGEIEHVAMAGGSASDRFTIGDLSTTAITLVETDFGQDNVADNLLVSGTMNNDTILLTGTDGNVSVTGLPWLVQAKGLISNGNTLVDGVLIDGYYGNDWLRSGIVSSSPMLVTLIGGQGSDLIEVNTMALGDNANRVTVIADGDIFADRILLNNGRNLVFGGPSDVIEVLGTENEDRIDVDGGVQPGRIFFDVNGQNSSNDLSNFEGVIHIDALGGNDVVTAKSYDIRTSVIGGLGSDVLSGSSMIGPVTLIGGSGDDMLIGGTSNDYLDGGEGFDQIFGGRGNDRVEGGSGSDSIFYTAGEGQDQIDGGEGVNNLFVTGLAHSANSIRLYTDIFDPTGIMFDVNDTPVAIMADAIQGVKLFGGDLADQFIVRDLSGTPLQSLIIDLGLDTLFGDYVELHGTIGNDVLGVGGAVDVNVTGLSYAAKITGFNFNPAATVIDRLAVRGEAGYDTLFANASLTAPIEVELDGGIGNDILSSEVPQLSNQPANFFRVTLIGGEGLDEFTATQGRVVLNGSGPDILHLNGNDLHNFMRIVQTGQILDFTLDSVLTRFSVVDYTGLLSIDGQGGNDSIGVEGYTFASTIQGGAGSDFIGAVGLNVAVNASGGDGNDVINGSSADDLLDGGAGNDTIVGNFGNDTIYGGDGSDRFYWFTGDGDDELDGGTGDDRLVFTADGLGDHSVTLTPATSKKPSTANGIGMGNANMILAAMAGDGSVTAGSIESVLLEGGDGCDLFGIGNLQTTDVRVVDVSINNPDGHAVVSTYATNLPDVITVTADSPDQIGVNGLAVPVRIFGAVADATAIVVHAGFGGDTIEVDPQAEAQAIIVIDGGSGNDNITGGSIIIGGNGNNLLVGSDGPNTIVGGTGSDTIYGLGADDKLFGDAEVLNIDILGPNCEYIGNLIILPTATGAPDSIFGGDGDDFINGNVGADSIYGGEGHDDIGALDYNGIFFPEPGNDLIDAGEGDNCVFSGEGDDTVIVGNGNNRIVLDTGNDKATTGNGNNSIFGGAGDDSVTTGSGADLVSLGEGKDTANLGSGNDIAWGGDGNDFIIGGYGNDSLYGGADNDILWGGIKATQPLKRGQKHAPIEPSDGDDVLAGNDGFDQLDGGNSNNIMDAGADYIRETMIGSGGWDTAYIHKNEGKFQDVLKNHSRRYTLIPYGAMMIPVTPRTPTDCDSPILVTVPNPLAGAQNSAPKKRAVPKSTVTRQLRGR